MAGQLEEVLAQSLISSCIKLPFSIYLSLWGAERLDIFPSEDPLFSGFSPYSMFTFPSFSSLSLLSAPSWEWMAVSVEPETLCIDHCCIGKAEWLQWVLQWGLTQEVWSPDQWGRGRLLAGLLKKFLLIFSCSAATDPDFCSRPYFTHYARNKFCWYEFCLVYGIIGSHRMRHLTVFIMLILSPYSSESPANPFNSLTVIVVSLFTYSFLFCDF